MTETQIAEMTEALAAPATDGAKLLGEARDFLGRFIAATPAQLTACVLWAAHTYALDEFPATPRLLFTSKEGGCGKTDSMMRVLSLSQNGWRARLTKDAIKSKFSEVDRPTVGYDEVSDIFGKSGRSGSNSPIGTILREGYKRGATESFSVNRVAEEVSTYAAWVITGRGNAVPEDILQRCIRIVMRPGTPAEQYEFREHDYQAEKLGRALGQWVQKNATEIGSFRARPTMHPRLIGRMREIFEPLLAVAAAAGPEPLRDAMSAFLEVGVGQADEAILTPRQTVLRDMSRAADALPAGAVAAGWALGADIRDEMRRFGEPMYDPMPDRALSMAMADALPDGAKRVITIGDRRGNGYDLAAIRREWSQMAPASAAAAVVADDLPDPDAVEVIG